MQTVPLPPPVRGYLGDTHEQGAFVGSSRNFILSGNLPVRRPGYSVFRASEGVSGTVYYTERIPCDEADGTARAAFLHGLEIYKDQASPSLLHTLSTDPWGDPYSPVPVWAYAYNRTVLVNGVDYVLLIGTGTDLVHKTPLEDPAAPTLGLVAGGSLADGTWYVRIRWYDSVTGTFSGPSARLTTAGSQTCGSGNNTISVQRNSPPSRATHWQIQLVQTTDAPSGYEITYEPVAGTGLIPIATTSTNITTAPASGDRFEFRTDGVQTVYRHANPPAGASMVVFHRGRWFYADHEDIWLVWSDIGNPEHFYHDTTDEAAGFNSCLGDGVGNSLSGPVTALYSNQYQLFIGQRGEIHVGEGSWNEVFNNDGTFIQRNARISAMASNGTGAAGPRFVAIDQEVFFMSPRGPAKISNGRVELLLPKAISDVWRIRDRAVQHRSMVTYDPDADVVLFSLATQLTGLQYPDMVLAWSRADQLWCPPWTLRTSGMSLSRYRTDSNVDRGLRVVLGSWYGTQAEWGVGEGDGWSGSDADAAGLTPTSYTTTSATVSGKSWSTDEYMGYGVVLVDANGTWHYRQIKENDSDTIEWDEAVTGFDDSWTVYIGSIPAVMHLRAMDANEIDVRGVRLVLADQASSRGA